MSGADITRAWRRVAHEVIESNRGGEGLVVLGIPRRGAPLAERLAAQLSALTGEYVPTAPLDVRDHRDDRDRSVARGAAGPASDAAPEVEGRTVVLVDDVLHSGRTVRAALDAVSALGRPRAIRLAVMVDRGHRELPIRADHVGKNLPTSTLEHVQVRVVEVDGTDEVRITGGAR